jgi:hypothetical protein
MRIPDYLYTRLEFRAEPRPGGEWMVFAGADHRRAGLRPGDSWSPSAFAEFFERVG